MNNAITQLLETAKAVEAKPVPIDSAELLPIAILLKEEKHLTWKEIRLWMLDNAMVDRSENFWQSAYKKVKGLKAKARAPRKAKTATSPAAVSSPASTSPVESKAPESTTPMESAE